MGESVSGWVPGKRRSAPLCGLCGLGRTLHFYTLQHVNTESLVSSQSVQSYVIFCFWTNLDTSLAVCQVKCIISTVAVVTSLLLLLVQVGLESDSEDGDVTAERGAGKSNGTCSQVRCDVVVWWNTWQCYWRSNQSTPYCHSGALSICRRACPRPCV